MNPPPKDRRTETHTAVGCAISAWSKIELEICSIFSLIVTTEAGGQKAYAEVSFWAIDSFQAKMGMLDAAMQLRLSLMSGDESMSEAARLKASDLLIRWNVIKKRAREKNSLRNDLAHGTVVQYFDPADLNSLGIYWVPSFWKNTSRDLPHLNQGFRKGQEPIDYRASNRLTAEEVGHRTKSFDEFATRLAKFKIELLRCLYPETELSAPLPARP